MSLGRYQIQDIRSKPDAALVRELAQFLARFVADGELEDPLPGDSRVSQWVQRMGWWWSENPFCREGHPLALVLREASEGVVGFLGFIPHDYEVDGKVVPGLISTTFFVRQGHRGQAMRMFLRAERATLDFHVVDGSPSPEMKQLLERFGYQSRSAEIEYFYTTRRKGLSPRKLALKAAGLGIRNRKDLADEGLRLIRDPGMIRSVAPGSDGLLRRRVTPEGLAWFVRSGSLPRVFRGAVDRDGSLLAYFIGVERKLRGVGTSFVIDYRSFDPDRLSVADLLAGVATNPVDTDLPDRVEVLWWPVYNGARRPRITLRRTAEIPLYYRLPRGWPAREKVALPSDGDTPLL